MTGGAGFTQDMNVRTRQNRSLLKSKGTYANFDKSLKGQNQSRTPLVSFLNRIKFLFKLLGNHLTDQLYSFRRFLP